MNLGSTVLFQCTRLLHKTLAATEPVTVWPSVLVTVRTLGRGPYKPSAISPQFPREQKKGEQVLNNKLGLSSKMIPNLWMDLWQIWWYNEISVGTIPH